jgi:hypothetical protein
MRESKTVHSSALVEDILQNQAKRRIIFIQNKLIYLINKKKTKRFISFLSLN